MSSRIHNEGDVVGDRYRIIEFLDEGGMQEVYRAEDQVLKRTIALKVPKNYSAEKRFERSAILSAKVNHPHVAKTFDYLEINGLPYLIEELVEGMDLKKVLALLFERIDPYLAARLLHYLAKGIAASHRVDVVHRDLKPSNIMISKPLSLGAIKITDFGVAKMAEEELADAKSGGDLSIESSKTMFGALPYMSPEMIDNPRGAHKAADVWSVAAIVYETLSGTKPFGTGLEAMKRIGSGQKPDFPDLLKKKDQFRPLGTQVYDLIISCLDMDPEQRPSANELARRCEDLCYPVFDRMRGMIVRYIYRETCGFVFDRSTGSEVFFHLDSVYGGKPVSGSAVCFASFEGEPRYRGHPLLPLKT